jgi:hypothetical protein
VQGAGLGLLIALVHGYAVFEAAAGPQLLVDGAAQLIDVVLLQPLIEVECGHLNREHVFLELDRENRLEPGTEALLADFRPNRAQASSPNGTEIFEH